MNLSGWRPMIQHNDKIVCEYTASSLWEYSYAYYMSGDGAHIKMVVSSVAKPLVRDIAELIYDHSMLSASGTENELEVVYSHPSIIYMSKMINSFEPSDAIGHLENRLVLASNTERKENTNKWESEISLSYLSSLFFI